MTAANTGRSGTDRQLASQARLDSMSPAKRALYEKLLGARHQSPADEIAAVARTGDLAVSAAQRRLWFMDQLNPGTTVYNISTALRLTGALRVDLLARSVRELFARHEALRTVFGSVDGAPVQRIRAELPVELAAEPLPAGLDLDAALRAETARPFALEQGPLVRVRLFAVGAAEHVFVLTVHHSVCDGWSMSIVLDELLELYRAANAGTAPALAPLPLQYADFAAWEARPQRQEELAAGLDYWRDTLRGAVPVLELPLDRPRPASQSFRGARHRFSLPAAVWPRVRDLAREERATPFMVLLAGFAALLSRYSSHREVSVMTPVGNRPRVEFETMVGFFNNSIALRVDTSGAPTFRELVGRVRETTQAGIARGDVPFDRVVEAVDPVRDLSHTPIAQVLFALREDPALTVDLGDVRATTVDHHNGTSQFELELQVWPGPDDVLSGYLEYATDLFDAATAERTIAHLGNLLDDLTAAPDTRIGDGRVLSDREHHDTVVAWNDTEDPGLGLVWAHEMFARQAARTPDATALVSGPDTVTFADLDRRAERLAARLRRAGVVPQSRVGLLLERGVDLVTAVLAVLKAGAVYLPLDSKDPAERIAFMLADADVHAVVTASGLAAAVPAGAARVLLADADADADGRPVDLPPVPRAHPDSACYIIYTSGSTGQPKGVVITHRGLANYLDWAVAAYRVADGGGAPLVSPLRFDLSVTTLFCPLLAGRPVVLVPEGEELDALARTLGHDTAFGLVKLTPGHLDALDKSIPPTAIEADGYLVVGGESLHGGTVAAWRTRAPGLRVVNEYGPTETVVGCCVYEVDDRTDLSATVPIGRPIANTSLYVLDENLVPVARGVVGELYVGGAGVARGYWNRPGLTAERFLPDPFATVPGARMYRTGDLVRLRADGELDCLGRADTQVKVRGYRVELEEIEAALARLEPVREAVVLLRKDLPGEAKLVAYVTAADADAPPAESDLRDVLRRDLPEYMVPDLFAILAELPLAASGKVDRAALPRPEPADPAPAAADTQLSPLEQVIAAIWCEVLGVASVGRDSNFIALGGHSLLAVQAMARLRKALDMDLPLPVFLEATSLGDLAARIEALGGRAPRPGLVPVPRTAPVPLSYAQGRLYFLSRLAEDSTFYNVPIAMRFDGEFHRGAFARAFAALWARHEGLRTSFPAPDGEPVQQIAPAEPVPYRVIDLEYVADAEQLLDELVNTEARTPFDLAAGPLVRGTLVRVAADAHAFLLTLHHSVSDGWSLSIVMDELVTLYTAFAKGEPDPLAPLPYTYLDYTVWQRKWLDAELDTQLGYWKAQLAGVPTLELPTDRPRPAVQSFRGAGHDIRWSRELSEAISALARRENVSLFMVLLAGFDVLMARTSGQRDITVGTPIANRTLTELENLVGFFANTLALRVDLSGDPTFTEVLRRVRETTHGAYAHQDVPFEMVVDAVAPTRSLSHSPLFQVRFALQNAPAATADPGGGLAVSILESEQRTARFDLLVDLWETDDGLAGHAEFSTDLFDAATVAQLMARLEELMRRLVADPAQPVFELDVLLPGERERLAGLDRTGELPGGARTFPQRFAEQARRQPEAAAVTCGATTVSYGELLRRSSAVARLLAAHGVGPGSLVAIHLDRGVDLVVAVLAVLEAGGAYVPLDPAYPADRIAAIMKDAQPALVLTGRSLAATAPTGPTGLLVLVDALPAPTDAPGPRPDLSPDDPAYVVFTSGTQGLPKGVVVTHGSLAAYLDALPAALDLPEAPVFLHTASFAFSSSVRQLMVPLSLGGTVVIATRDQLSAPDALLAYAARHGVQVLDLVPSYLRVVEPALARSDRWRPELILTASEPLRYDLPEAVRAASGPIPRLVNMYGQTETTGIVTTVDVPAQRVGRGAVVPLGRPIPGTAVYLLDEQSRQVPPGHPGEIVIGGAGLAQGYLGDPDLTARRFIDDPSGSGGRLYRTGDRGRLLPDGTVEFLGRLGDQVKIRGHRVEPEEVTAVLSAVAGVGECAVVCVEEAADERRLVAYTVLRAGTTTDQVRAALREKLPDYMVPTLVPVGAVPRLPNGKVDRTALATAGSDTAPGAAPAPRGRVEDALVVIWQEVLRLAKVGTGDDFFALGGDSLHVIRVVDRARKAGITITPAQFLANPTIAELAAVAVTEGGESTDRGRVEDALVVIWQEVLRLAKVGTGDNFFALGGDSLHVIRVVDRARKAGITITPAQFLANPTIAELAAVAVPAEAATGPAAPQADPDVVPFVPSHLAFLERDFADKHLYTHIFMFETREPADPKTMELAVRAVVEHHDSLRICFPYEGGGYRVRVRESLERTPFTSVDLSALDPDDQEAAFLRLDHQLHRKLDFNQGPLLHFALVKFGPARPDMVVAIVHHQLMDNSSWDVLVDDLQTAYVALAAGRRPDLPPLTSTFMAWARNLDRLARSSALAPDIAYWTELARRPVPAWPLDHVGGDDCMTSEEMLFVGLTAEETTSLRRSIPRDYGITVNDALAAAVLQGYADWTGDRSVLIDLVRRGRELGGDDLDLSRAIGRFSMTSPRLLHLPQQAGPRALLESVAEQVRAVPRAGLGFGLLRYLGAHPQAAQAIAPLGKPPILLNNWGEVEHVEEDSPLFGPRIDDLWPMPKLQRMHRLMVNGRILDGRLDLGFRFSRNLNDRAGIERLADLVVGALRSFVAAADPTDR
ncbi:amino acid adenylation domain-containing protein [Catellatospora sp. KI3]|uniref:non-ribosomal peptide synthetase n=1 Tax=Catellatospora sp. KI3 TaxID=3041620 RepID=UPI002482BDB5|nr:non-ribosomal peptide synthetase [Catellatospora sp. KI3]MDI1463737.1 amino acid adenylation domain-containing protein [Catellatospora sp. KI3]